MAVELGVGGHADQLIEHTFDAGRETLLDIGRADKQYRPDKEAA
ncbi:MAG TPA: hypothetical protein VF377_15100 [Acidimicrobiia bacterium]